ncbi:hypothetical protein DFJ74DRAFT_676180 [Hyaloraphidium curvatum]|nr:hypothetical protein DFJ74DRAFT_676180 [Hyaloraphidium curvatum]
MVDWRSVDVASFLPPPSGRPVAVVGGSGFVGRNVVALLLLAGEEVHNLDISPPRTPDPRVQFLKTDIRDPASVRAALASRPFGTVFLVAALLSYAKRHDSELQPSIDVNINGTKNVIDACRDLGIPFLVQTSTSNVVIGFDNPRIVDGDESLPYTTRPFNHYCRTKAEAEKLVLAADGTPSPSGGPPLRTCAVRPASTIFGHRDGTLLDLLDAGYPMMAQDPEGIIDYTPVENVALGHLLAAHSMRSGGGAAGRAFLVGNRTITHAQFAGLVRVHLPSLKLHTMRFLYPVAWLSDTLHWMMPRTSLGSVLDKLTLATWELSKATYTFRSDAAEGVLGYREMYSVAQGLAKAADGYVEEGRGAFAAAARARERKEDKAG